MSLNKQNTNTDTDTDAILQARINAMFNNANGASNAASFDAMDPFSMTKEYSHQAFDNKDTLISLHDQKCYYGSAQSTQDRFTGHSLPWTLADSHSLPDHVDPSSMWLDQWTDPSYYSNSMYPASTEPPIEKPRQNSKFASDTRQRFGQITPPDDRSETSRSPIVRKRPSLKTSDSSRRDSAVDIDDHDSMPASKKRKTSKSSKVATDDLRYDDEDKREKYREKNRVAAAKCRAKKRNHVGDLEENNRTQSLLNAALRQTEQSLRDDLSHLRTQALQHSFCNCHSIQDHNMRKAQHLVASGALTNATSMSSPSQHRSPSSFSASSAAFPGLRSPSEIRRSPAASSFY